ncbi:NUDIX hydrolase [Ferrovum sp. PN-J185]|uniref:NUDIX hydrolase n=1 Tax=Ferrovum sp. PN-J185 TaxID=1356306 RepID=UPI000796F9D0|nr:NUDIX hydrolase [Ferrovum sp. PN-J185]KXW56200.1 NADH pyrophosphatase [Ferrovum sp. PN-J185]MCC6067738.1 NUDIX hydrolase [Ferrovum sp. PN-J185]MDE1892244.1 NUDIX hydrolase [Betaproteobacteria bacterium]MDE2056842.1 NUDIX hydrolase [Betaproteobacteria bacterium]
MKFCSSCGAEVTITIPEGDQRERHVCQSCGDIHYQNPKVVVGCVTHWHDQVLLCRRAIEPRLGFWTMPAGFMENGESLRQGAKRETEEECGAQVEVGELISVISIANINQVHCIFNAPMVSDRFFVTSESSEVRLFHEHEIPWQDLAFRTVEVTLKHFFDTRRQASVSPLIIDLGPH